VETDLECVRGAGKTLGAGPAFATTAPETSRQGRLIFMMAPQVIYTPKLDMTALSRRIQRRKGARLSTMLGFISSRIQGTLELRKEVFS
jgi:hypothetical protein